MKDRTPATPDPDDLPPLNLGDGDEPGLGEASDDSVQNARLKPFDYGSANHEEANAITAASSKFADAGDDWVRAADSLNATMKKLADLVASTDSPNAAAGQAKPMATPRLPDVATADPGALPSSPKYESANSTFAPSTPSGPSASQTRPSPQTPKTAAPQLAVKSATAGNASPAAASAKAMPSPKAASGKASSVAPLAEASKYAGPTAAAVQTVTNYSGASGPVSNIATSAAIGASVGGPAGATAAGGMQAVAEASRSASKALYVLQNSINSSASRLDKYSGSIASANAKAEERQIIGDVRRAEYVGKEVGRYTEVASKFSQHAQDLEATLLKAGATILSPLLEMLEPVAQFMLKHAENFISEMLDSMGRLVQFIAIITEQEIPDFAIALQAVAFEIKNAANKDKEKEGLDINEFMASFLAGHGMGAQAGAPLFGDVPRQAPPGRRGFRGAMPPLPGRFGLPGMDLGGAGRGM